MPFPASSQTSQTPRRRLQRRGYDCCWTAEINHDPFLPLVLAAEHTSTIELGTSIAVAFARNPMTVAQHRMGSAGVLARAGSSSVSARRFSATSRTGSACRGAGRWRACGSSCLALHEIWSCWQNGTKLSFDGEFYTHKLMTPMFTPEPLAHDVPKVFVAAVGEAMTEMCGRSRRRSSRPCVHDEALLRGGDDTRAAARHAAVRAQA